MDLETAGPGRHRLGPAVAETRQRRRRGVRRGIVVIIVSLLAVSQVGARSANVDRVAITSAVLSVNGIASAATVHQAFAVQDLALEEFSSPGSGLESPVDGSAVNVAGRSGRVGTYGAGPVSGLRPGGAGLVDLLVDPAMGCEPDMPSLDSVQRPCPQQVGTAGMGPFDPGAIISDQVFYDTGAMTDEQIRGFIADRGSGCAGPHCLKSLQINTESRSADKYCADYSGADAEDAAAVIGKVSRACGVNPQVMLTTLQKESALVTATRPTDGSYDAAWGWHCPDTGPGGSANCDPQYAGFFNQAYGMAQQWSRYRVEPEKYRHHAGQTIDILWNVAESGCGAAPVTIHNTATAALYNYTPYQPNEAALTSYPNVGDRCSAYGNRNFFFLFRSWFGSTGASGSGAVASLPVVIPESAYVPAALVGRTINAPNSAVAAGLIAGFAELGLPYVWGGGGSGAAPNNGCARGGGQLNSCGSEIGFDCSGLTAYVLGQAGFTIPGDSGGQRRAGVKVGWDQAMPGDIVGFPGHVAVYLGVIDGVRYILEAPSVGSTARVVELTRNDADAMVHRYWSGGRGAGPPKSIRFLPTVPRISLQPRAVPSRAQPPGSAPAGVPATLAASEPPPASAASEAPSSAASQLPPSDPPPAAAATKTLSSPAPSSSPGTTTASSRMSVTAAVPPASASASASALTSASASVPSPSAPATTIGSTSSAPTAPPSSPRPRSTPTTTSLAVPSVITDPPVSPSVTAPTSTGSTESTTPVGPVPAEPIVPRPTSSTIQGEVTGGPCLPSVAVPTVVVPTVAVPPQALDVALAPATYSAVIAAAVAQSLLTNQAPAPIRCG